MHCPLLPLAAAPQHFCFEAYIIMLSSVHVHNFPHLSMASEKFKTLFSRHVLDETKSKAGRGHGTLVHPV